VTTFCYGTAVVTTAAALRLRFLAAALVTVVGFGLLVDLPSIREASTVRAFPLVDRIPLYREREAAAMLGTFLAIAAVALVRLPTHHPFTRLGTANLVTLVRAALAAWAAGLSLAPPHPKAAWLAVGLATAFALLDGIDGTLARRSGLASPFGARFDMEVDALFILVLSALVWHHGKAGAWVLACGLMRYAFVAARWPLPWMGGPLPPTRRGKTVAAVQFVGLAAALAPIVPSPASDGVAAVALALLAWSFAVDVRRLHKQRTDR
jgi:phosphatidylglycerophosphate synthase